MFSFPGICLHTSCPVSESFWQVLSGAQIRFAQLCSPHCPQGGPSVHLEQKSTPCVQVHVSVFPTQVLFPFAVKLAGQLGGVPVQSAEKSSFTPLQSWSMPSQLTGSGWGKTTCAQASLPVGWH